LSGMTTNEHRSSSITCCSNLISPCPNIRRGLYRHAYITVQASSAPSSALGRARISLPPAWSTIF